MRPLGPIQRVRNGCCEFGGGSLAARNESLRHVYDELEHFQRHHWFAGWSFTISRNRNCGQSGIPFMAQEMPDAVRTQLWPTKSTVALRLSRFSSMDKVTLFVRRSKKPPLPA